MKKLIPLAAIIFFLLSILVTGCIAFSAEPKPVQQVPVETSPPLAPIKPAPSATVDTPESNAPVVGNQNDASKASAEDIPQNTEVKPPAQNQDSKPIENNPPVEKPPVGNEPEKPKDNAEKVAFLTFDDGPDSTNTPVVLEILRKNNIHATFFMLGQYVTNHPDLAAQAIKEGNIIGNHTYSHIDINKSSLENFKSEVTNTNQIILKATGYTPKLFRPPYGRILPQGYKSFLKDAGFRTFVWNIDSGDSRRVNVPSEEICKNVASSLGNNPKVLILMHDGPGHKTTVQALPSIIKMLTDNGYDIQTLSPDTDTSDMTSEIK